MAHYFSLIKSGIKIISHEVTYITDYVMIFL